MNKNFTIYLYFAVVMLVTACAPKANSVTESDGILPDIPAIIKADMSNFSNNKLQKTVIVDNNSEVKNIDAPDWENELSLFLEAQINKPAWIDKYSVIEKGNTTTISAEDDDLIIRKIEKKGKEITIEKQKSNLLYESKEKLTWQPTQNKYSIVSDRKVVLGNWQHIEINGVIK